MQLNSLKPGPAGLLTKKRIYICIEFFVVLIICFFPLCYRIDTLAVRQWDEARNAVHTVEMMENHNYIVRYFQGKPEVWEPKPPLLVWLQVISSHIFGLNEFAIRFPVMIATCLTSLLLILYFYKYYNIRYTGYLIAFVLVTSQGYIEQHVARTGDHDALLILFTTSILLCFHRYLTTDKPQHGILIGIAMLFVFGVYTKSVAALFILPGLLFSVFMFRSGRKLFSDPWFYIAFMLFIVLTGSYYLIRDHIQPGYLSAVWHWELFPRYANTENQFNTDNFWFYARNFYDWRFTYWIWLLIPAMVTLPFLLKREMRHFYYYILLNIVTFFIVLSLGSKGTWYDGPMYPLFAITIGLFLHSLAGRIYERTTVNKKILRIVTIVAFIGIFLYPYISVVKKISRSEEYSWDREYYSMSYVLRDKGKLQSLPNPLKVVFNGYDAHLQFYVKARNYELETERIKLMDYSQLSAGDTILISQPRVMDSIENNFHYEVLFSEDPLKLVRIF